jgi:hypothetical protein
MKIEAIIAQLKETHDALVHTTSPGYAANENHLAESIRLIERTYAAHQAPVVVPKRVYKGDIGVVKKALKDAGMLAEFAQFYNDKNVKGRRLKCCNATALWDADPSVRALLCVALQAAFGARWDSMYFIPVPRYYGTGMQLCVKLHS